ncbi:MAG: DUF3617 family protein [Pseudomonadota bacterium]
MPGRYRIEVRIEIPNVDTRDYDFTQTLCLASGALSRLGPLGPGPMRDCPRRVSEAEGSVTVEVICNGPNAGTATGHYTASSDGFTGVVQMNMGGKNMTLIERHRAERLGNCAD